jgi:hypothetical protein
MNPLSITGCAGWIECGVNRRQAKCEAVTVSEGHVVLCWDLPFSFDEGSSLCNCGFSG